MWFLVSKLLPRGTFPYIVLNIIRALNVLSILACMLSTVALLVKTSTSSLSTSSDSDWFTIFSLAEKALILLLCIFLLLTEIPQFSRLRDYLERNWRLFSDVSGFATFALFLLFLGCDVLSYLTEWDSKKGREEVGEHWYRLVQAAGLMCVVMASVNLITGILLKDRRRGLTARQVRGLRRRQGGSDRDGV